MMPTVEFDEKVVCNDKFIAVRVLDNLDELKVGDIYLPGNVNANERLAFGHVESIGVKAQETTGLDVGDYVLFDRLSTFCHTYPVALLEYNNVICKTNKDNSQHFPLKGMLFAKPDAKEPVTDVNGIFVPNYKDKLNTATVIAEALTDDAKDKFAIGDHVLLAKGADVVELGTTTIYIYKQDMLVCKIEG